MSGALSLARLCVVRDGIILCAAWCRWDDVGEMGRGVGREIALRKRAASGFAVGDRGKRCSLSEDCP